MTTIPQNRMADPEKRGQGRPPKSEPRLPSVEAEPMVIPDTVMTCTCPRCGRGQQPKVVRRRPTGERDCTCSLCGRQFVYTPATIRPI